MFAQTNKQQYKQTKLVFINKFNKKQLKLFLFQENNIYLKN